LRTIFYTALCLVSLAVGTAFAEVATVVRAYGDEYGAVHVIYSNGKEKTISKPRGTVGVEDVRVAGDGQTVGWLVLWPDPDELRKWAPLPGTLVIWRKGKIVRRISPGPGVFYAWCFWRGESQVGFSFGPTHGPRAGTEYELRNISTGAVVEDFSLEDDTDPAKVPTWVNAVIVAYSNSAH
jgi:hypothetical protein